MVGIWEVLDRAVNTGPVMASSEFDMNVFETATRLAKEHDVAYDPSNPVPSDDSVLDDVFDAGVALFLEVGTYCMSTERIIKFTEDEVKDGLSEVSNEIEVGEGLERRRLFQRKAEDQREPLYLGGVIESNPQEGEIFVKLYQSMAQEKIVDGLYFGPPHTIEGKVVRFGSPLEAHAHTCATMWVREALSRVGRPGLHLISASPSAIGDITACNPENGLRRSDAIAVSTTSELKTDCDHLMKVVYSLRYGCIRNPYTNPIVGGFAGGPNTAAIISIAGALQAILVYQARVAGYFVCTGDEIRTSGECSRSVLWFRNTAVQALQKNTRLILCGCSGTAAGPGTEQMLLECAANALGLVASGGNVAHGVRRSILVKRNQASGLEVKFHAEVAKAAAGLRRADANEMVKELMKKYEADLVPQRAPEGKSFEDLYDLNTLKPRPEYLQVYSRAKKDLEELGMIFE